MIRTSISSLLLVLLILLTACGGQSSLPESEAPASEEATSSEANEVATTDEEVAHQGTTDTMVPPPAFAEATRDYEGVTISYYGDSVGLGAEVDMLLAEQFTADTGIAVDIVPKPMDASANYATYQRVFESQSSDIDVMMLDVIWPGAFAPHLLDLSTAMEAEIALHYDTIITNNTVDERLVAMPWFGDFGMLYYRTDLLEKYGYAGPPATWDELEEIAATIQAGERAEGNNTFVGFVWQGAAYEGLTCDALEWIYTHGGGVIVNEDGEVTLNNPQAVEAINRAASWVGTISPAGVVSFREEDSRTVFQGGNAAFMRNWPYAYAAGNESGSPIRGKFDVTPLPTANGAESAGTVGGWQLGVSAYSENPEAAIEFVRYMTSPETQRWRAIVGSYVPTIPEVAADPDVVEAMPFLETMSTVVRITRPSAQAGERYNDISMAFYQSVYAALQDGNAGQALAQAAAEIESGLQ